ncbi:MAG: hypothetical protein COU33_05310 [Candidatus Magasanikbacteria bacterium CG10_big_fil_rev_8_21_14_0_10_43_6]|uniref:Uncharacterized protein n=1 Tax=Candidatus Magasanikbacteria bacterium CG10_big_fil_rev_8_21_14_0_10_43_6 TaxID=1974650 RepID=A0A2M6VZQ8_9BACT|nr:MAG: hypothetical protein COU33_05310 [Candidatus Magasanikbacteria bacterium CG10_big_fil_rev_8_21_14_0_10_43_6]
MFLESLIPVLPSSLAEIFIYVGAYLGIIFLVYAIFIEQEFRQDLIRMLGAGGIMIYGLYIENSIVTIAMAAVMGASLIEFLEILVGLHKHGPEDLKRYKKMWRIEKKS